MIDAMSRILDVLRPTCPSGLGHRQRGGMVTNELGSQFCWHPDCIKASSRQVMDAFYVRWVGRFNHP